MDDVLHAATNSAIAHDANLSVTNDVPEQTAEQIADENDEQAIATPAPDLKTLRIQYKKDPHDDAARRELVEALAHSESIDALADLQKIARAAPDDAATQAALAEFLARQDDVDSAITHMVHAIRLNPAELRYRSMLAVMYDQSGEGAKALTLYRQIMAAMPDLGSAAPANLPMASIRARARYLASDVE